MPKHEFWHPASYTKAEIRAVQELLRYAQSGDIESPPSPQAVRRALDWIVIKAAGTYEEPFTPGSPDTIAYLLGRRSVGLQIIKMQKLKPENFND